jgi:hypothetical protein
MAIHQSKAKVLPGWVAFGGWRGELSIDGDLIRIAGADHSRTLEIDVRQIKRASFISNNGLLQRRPPGPLPIRRHHPVRRPQRRRPADLCCG